MSTWLSGHVPVIVPTNSPGFWDLIAAKLDPTSCGKTGAVVGIDLVWHKKRGNIASHFTHGKAKDLS